MKMMRLHQGCVSQSFKTVLSLYLKSLKFHSIFVMYPVLRMDAFATEATHRNNFCLSCQLGYARKNSQGANRKSQKLSPFNKIMEDAPSVYIPLKTTFLKLHSIYFYYRKMMKQHQRDKCFCISEYQKSNVFLIKVQISTTLPGITHIIMQA